ncbi:uncharacterized protein LOC116916606 [Daphnia magna]|uniref:BMP and activin membrane-bound inhibitor n=1 Tax=Daphnia magna TaxID=35525 RepID=A0ABR0A0M1_9CRUS|nr:uncharacterized protein LOC116916606 [Daphnia magna]KAK4018444.1 hypothetical protein OUZ56_000498 [Daphnia magna]
MSVVLLLLIVAAVSDSAVIDSDSPSPARQRLVSSQAIVESDYSSEMYSQKRPMETIDDLMNALAQVTKSKDELRCHCNLPVCVTTGYMCKSAMGTCFSEIVDRSDLSRSRHGCLELLSSDHQVCHSSQSHNNGRHAAGHRHLHPQRPLVLCCQDDLCNYGAQQVQLRLDSAVQTGNRNDSSSSSSTGVQEPRTVAMETRLFGDGQAVGNGGHDLWLKAATIAVPIAGGCILVLLVLLAIRMLRRDRENNNDVLMGNNYTVPTNRNDFQIRSVWGKSRQIQHEPAYHHVPQHQQQQQQQQRSGQWKDCQLSMAQQQQQQQYRQHQQHQHRHHPHQVAPLLHAPHNIVYMPTVQKIIPPKRIMWNKSCMLAKNPGLQHL